MPSRLGRKEIVSRKSSEQRQSILFSGNESKWLANAYRQVSKVNHKYENKTEGLSGLSQATRDLLRKRTKPDFRKQSTKEGQGTTTQEA